MKLEFESNAVSSPLVTNDVPAEFQNEHSSPEINQNLRDGIKAAQDGDQAEARTLLLRVTEADPKNENAWLWLASISEYPEELLVFLNNVLAINPENERAIEWAKATKSLIAKTFVQRGIDASKEDQKKFAKQCFLQAIVHDPESELAWLWLASVTDSSDEKSAHLQKVLSINPENENALSSLKNVRRQYAKKKLPKANAAAISGYRETANEILEEIFKDAPDIEDAWMLKAHISESFEDKIAAFEKVLEINPENPVARANVDSLRMFAAEHAEAREVDEDSDDSEDSVSADDVRFDSGSAPDRVTEAYNSLDSENSENPHHEEESVAFEEVESESGEYEESVPESMQVFQDEELIELGVEVEDSAEAHADDSPNVYAESADADDEHESVELSSDSDVSNEADEYDHDGENSEDANDSESDSTAFEFAEEGADFTPEEISEFEAEGEAEVSKEEADDIDETAALFESDEDEGSEEAVDEAHLESAEQEDAAGSETDEVQDPEFEIDDAVMSAEDDPVEEANDSVHEDEPEAAMPVFDAVAESTPVLAEQEHARPKECPYCQESNDHQAFACKSCKAIFTISDIEMILSHTKANAEVISKSLQRMETNKTLRGVDIEELKHLGIGYMNLSNFRKGFEYLQEAAKKDPNDVVLVSQIDALAIRLAEIEEHERDHEPTTLGKKILVVDDSPTVRKLISGKLEKCGHEAICAVDGMDALAKINEEIPDLILLDITMPRMDGYQVCKLIRGNDATKDVPVVMISGKDGFFDKVRGRMAGTSNYITKPFGPETLMKTVNEYLQ